MSRTSSPTKKSQSKSTRTIETPPKGESGKPRKSIQSVEIGVRVLAALVEASKGSAPLRAIAEKAGLSRSQTHRYLVAYLNAGFVAQEKSSGHYSLGPMALKVGLVALSRLDFIKHATDELASLVKEVGCTGHISVWGDYGPTIIRWFDGARPVVTSLNLGSVTGLQGSATGLIYLSFSPEGKTSAILEQERAAGLGPNTARLEALISNIRKQGYAMVDGQLVPGLAAVAAPIFDLQGWPAATIGLVARSEDQIIQSQPTIDRVLAAAGNASCANGWQEQLGPAITGSGLD